MDERDGVSAVRRGPVVSVIVPTCDRPGTLLPCLRSILDQQLASSMVEMEVLVVDDGRPGSAQSVVDQLRDDRVSVIPCTAGNAAAARNLGVETARGEWLAFCDDDDLWAPDKLVSQLEALEGSGAGWACTGAIVVDGDLQVIGHQRVTGGSMERLSEISVVPGGGSTVIARTDLVREVGGFDDELTNAEDWDLWLRLRDRSDPVVVDRPLVAYRRWGASKSTDTSMLTTSLDTIVGRNAGPRRSHVRERYIADQWLRSGRRIRAARAYADLTIAHHRPPDAARAVASLVVPGALSRHDGRKALAMIPSSWRAEVETWLPQLRTTSSTAA